MIHKQNTAEDSLVYYRLIALWVLNEAMLGGIIHGLKLPVSGLIVGGCAVICISLIGWYVPKKGAILKATLIVAIFKMMLSPHSPAPAYIAVFFQGLLGELLFWNRKFFTLSCLLLAFLSLVESAMQRIVTLTITYGGDFWRAINEFISKLTGQKQTIDYSLMIGAIYVLIHAITGLLVGWWASTLPRRVTKWNQDAANRISITADSTTIGFISGKRKGKLKIGLFIIWIILLLLYVQSYFGIGTPLLSSHISFKILLRSIIIVLAWVFIVGPLLRQLLHYWLQKRKSASQQDVQRVLQLLPSTQQLIAESWKQSGAKKGLKRINLASKLILANSLTNHSTGVEQGKNIFILTGPIQSGKTTSLIKWAEERKDVFGVLTPVVNGKRMFRDAHIGQLFDMEAREGEKETLHVGRFVFSKANFEKASAIITEAMNKEGWLVIDEVGPLELRCEGFYQVVKQISQTGKDQPVLLVVREGMAEKVAAFFAFNDPSIIRSIDELKGEIAASTVNI